jgi:hypothetical protein
LLNGYDAEQVSNLLLTAAADSCRTSQDLETEIANAINGAIDYLRDHPDTKSVHRPNVRRDPLGFPINGNRIDKRKPRLPIDNELKHMVLAGEKLTFDEGDGVDQFNYQLLFANLNLCIAACREIGKGYAVKTLNDWKFMANFPKMGYIVPSYFCESGCTRSDLNIGERLFIVVEFDSGSASEQTKLHSYLNRTNPAFPLIMLVWSGHKSVHGWYASYGNSERRVRTFQRKASSLGADQTCVSPSAWIRMPNGFNYKHRTIQKVIYFDIENLDIQNELVRRELL